MQEAALGVKGEAVRDKRLDAGLSLTVSWRHVNDKASALAIYDVLQGFEDALMVFIDYEGPAILSKEHRLGVLLQRGQQLQAQ